MKMHEPLMKYLLSGFANTWAFIRWYIIINDPKIVVDKSVTYPVNWEKCFTKSV